MRLLMVFALATLALAGCTENSAPASNDDFSENLQLEVTDETGLIRGVVVDNAIVPVADAAVAICGSDAEPFLTAEDGAFGFDGLDPGFYRLCISKLGYTPVEIQSSVEAGVAQPPIVKVLLEPIPGFAPFYNLFTWEGYIQCNTTNANLCFIINYYPDFLLGTGSVTDDSSVQKWHEEFISVGKNPDWLQVETVWESTQPLGSELNIRYETSDPEELFIPCVFGSQRGVSPQIYTVNGTQTRDAGLGAPDPDPDGEGCDISDAADGFAMEFFGGQTPPVPFGVTVEQRTTSFFAVFYDYTPPADWVFIEAGEVPPPQ